MPDEYYSVKLEGQSIGSIVITAERVVTPDYLPRKCVPLGKMAPYLSLISALQIIHDEFEPETWKTLLKLLAEKTDLYWKFG